MSTKKYVYLFSEGNASMRELLGGKGANLAEMTNLGLPVPQGFTISTEACTQYYEDGRKINDDIQAEIMENISKMEKITGKKFGDKENPLLVSVRSGARASMPGMMDTILNLGLNEQVVDVIAAKSGNPRWAWDCYRRFIQMFSDVVMEVGKKYFEKLIDEMKERKGVEFDVDLTADDLKDLANQFKAEYKKQLGTDFPDDPKVQLFEAIKAVFAEAVASTDEELMEKYFDGEELSTEEKIKGLKLGVADGSIIPVFALSGITGIACDMLLDFIADVCPGPKSEYAIDSDGEPVELTADENGPLAAICFKTVADPFIGKLSYFKVVSGKFNSSTPAFNANTGKEERMGKIVKLFGAKQTDVGELTAGDIGAVTKLSGFSTGDTLCSSSNIVKLDTVNVPVASYKVAISSVKKGDEEKISSGILRLCEEDPSLSLTNNIETHQMILSGVGEQQVDVAVSRLKDKFGVEAKLDAPKVAYRETITKKVSAQGRHKKQSGGHGQFGDVFIEFEPYDTEKLIFAERIVGGAVPKNFFPAVEKGLNECMEKGILAGFPMVGIKATLYDGSYHPVDSSEMSFKMAATIAFKEGVANACPVLLEPIVTLRATVNDDAMGDIIGDINRRRGRVLGMSPVGDGNQEIIAEVPEGEMSSFSTSMRQITQGRGSFTTEFARYERVPEHIAQKVINESKDE